MSTKLEETGSTIPDGAFSAGATFGRYRIVRLIGHGGMGAVYEGFHLDLQKRVAIKALRPEMASDTLARSRFVREGRAAARLRHPHVVDVTDVGEHEGIAFLVMELLEGEDLAHLLAREGPLSEARTVEYMLPVCMAIAAAHEQEIVHRDLKPENIFLARDGFGEIQPKVLDFGISKVRTGADDPALTGSAALLGTAYYMSPEQAVDPKRVDNRSDQYSLGVILYQCVTSRRPFEGASLFSVLYAIAEGRFEPPGRARPGLSPELEAVIVRAMSVSPDARFPSVTALARALLPFAEPAVEASWQRRVGTLPPSSAEAPPPASAPSVAPTTQQDTLNAASREIDQSVASGPSRSIASRIVPVAAAAAIVIAGWSMWSHSSSWHSNAAIQPQYEARPVAVALAPPPAPAQADAGTALIASPAPTITAPAESPPAPVAVPHASAHASATRQPHAHPAHTSGCRELDNGAFDCSGEGP